MKGSKFLTAFVCFLQFLEARADDTHAEHQQLINPSIDSGSEKTETVFNDIKLKQEKIQEKIKILEKQIELSCQFNREQQDNFLKRLEILQNYQQEQIKKQLALNLSSNQEEKINLLK